MLLVLGMELIRLHDQQASLNLLIQQQKWF